jgi:hypothetical protein
MPTSVAEVDALSWKEMKFIFAISYAQAISVFVNDGEEALVSEVKRWEPEARVTVARVHSTPLATSTPRGLHTGAFGA